MKTPIRKGVRWFRAPREGVLFTAGATASTPFVVPHFPRYAVPIFAGLGAVLFGLVQRQFSNDVDQDHADLMRIRTILICVLPAALASYGDGAERREVQLALHELAVLVRMHPLTARLSSLTADLIAACRIEELDAIDRLLTMLTFEISVLQDRPLREWGQCHVEGDAGRPSN